MPDFDYSEIIVDDSGYVFGKGWFTADQIKSEPQKFLCYRDGHIKTGEAVRDKKTGLIQRSVTNTVYQASRSLREAIDEALKSSQNKQFYQSAVGGELLGRRLGLTHARMESVVHENGGCTINIYLITEEIVAAQARVRNLQIVFRIDGLTRSACYGAHVFSKGMSKGQTVTLDKDSWSLESTLLTFVDSSGKLGCIDQNNLTEAIYLSAEKCRIPLYDSLDTYLTLKGFGRNVIDTLLLEADNFSLEYSGKDIGESYRHSRAAYEVDALGQGPSCKSAMIAGKLTKAGLELRYILKMSGVGDYDRIFTIPWINLIIHRFQIDKHVQTFLTE